MKTYKVKEIYFTLQGEGMHTGRPAVFCRFTGCNLWSGREEDRAQAICNFCDTNFVGVDGENGGSYLAVDLAQKVLELWKQDPRAKPYVVCTGGEPLLQLDHALVKAFHELGLEVAIETNGTREVPAGVDWICVSPKPNVDIKIKCGDELKLIFPQEEISPEMVKEWDFTYFFLQPLQDQMWEENTRRTMEYCLKNPQWRLSLQTHKYIGLK